MMHFLEFAGKSSQDFNIRISGEGTYNRPERNYEEYEVKGRNGKLLIDDGSFKNITITYPAYAIKDMPERVKNFSNYMSKFAGYQRLEDTYSPDIFRMAQYVGGLEVESSGYMNDSGQFDISFNCKPQRFLKSGEIPVTFLADGNIWNRTDFESMPLIHVVMTGAGTVGIGDYLIELTDIEDYVDIDCELMDAYKGSINYNPNVSFNADSFKIPTGVSGVTFTGAVQAVEITPRYFII